MKKTETIWGAIILVLIALSAWVAVGTHTNKAGVIVQNFPTHYGLDIKGGVRAVLQARTDKMAPGATYDQDTVYRILENRLNGAGVGEVPIQKKGRDQFVVELPDVRDKGAILARLGTTAQLTFYYFKDVNSGRTPGPITLRSTDAAGNPVRDSAGHEVLSFFDSRTGQTFRDGAHVRADFTALLGQGTNPRKDATATAVPAPLGASVPAGTTLYLNAAQQKTVTALNAELLAWNTFLASCPVILTGNEIEPKSTASLSGGGLTSEPSVSQVFTASGAAKFAEFTRAHFAPEPGGGDIMGVVLDDAVISAPRIISPILNGEGQITGSSTLKEAQDLANLLNAGALPVPLEQVQVQSVEASLGQGAVQKSVLAGAVGLSLVLLFMLAFYRLPGLVADIALLIYALFVYAIFKGGLAWLGLPAVTLTLPGIAGFILSIGMAVDANILIFERMKEELRGGRALRPSIDAGFRRAFPAIRDSNICTAITCVVLLSIGTPSVRGFALTLLIGVAVSLFSAITVTRTLLYLLVNRSGKALNLGLFGVTRDNNISAPRSGTPPTGEVAAGRLNIIGRRKFFYGLSALIIVPGLVFWLGLHGLKPSIEFTGGTQMEVKYPTVVTSSAVENALTSAGYVKPHVQMAEGGTTAIVSVKDQSPVADTTLNPVHQKLASALGTLGAFQEQQFGNVGGVISREVTTNAIQAVVIASLLIVLYLATVFGVGGFVAGLRLGTSAIAALLHDVLVLVGAFAIFGKLLGWEIDSLFVTALLTVIGFSVHDTVVIFDRVRENQRLRQRGEAFEPLVNRSINQTLRRSLFTSCTVLLTLLSLILFGGQTTRLLNVALFIGILSGTYSSIFNAAAILVDWENGLARRRGREPALAAAGVSPPPSVTANGGSSRPQAALPDAPAARAGDGFSRPATTAGTDAARARPKKKGPARRF